MVDLQNKLQTPAVAGFDCDGDVRRGKDRRRPAGHPLVKEGRLAEIAEYCCYDVKITKLVRIRPATAAGHYHNRFGKKDDVPVSW